MTVKVAITEADDAVGGATLLPQFSSMSSTRTGILSLELSGFSSGANKPKSSYPLDATAEQIIPSGGT